MAQRISTVEDLAIDRDFWAGRRVLVTGHTGFKGAWLAFLLNEMGADIAGLALPPTTTPSLFDLLDLGRHIHSVFGDIKDRRTIERLITEHRPEIVLHLAAQALVRASYRDPIETFATNVVGTATLLDAIRCTPHVRAIVVVTSDKCYDNKEWPWGYRETDRLGGRDPYSASKACVEITTGAMRQSFFAPYARSGHPARIATVRAGNVIGGGDWSADRLLPDIMRAILGGSGEIRLRNPNATRPWQHVLEPTRGYLAIAQRLITSPEGIDEEWNIGPAEGDARAVCDIAQAFVTVLGRGHIVIDTDPAAPHEPLSLSLDCSKAKTRLHWSSQLSFEDTIKLTAAWYSGWFAGEDIRNITRKQIAAYLRLGHAPDDRGLS